MKIHQNLLGILSFNLDSCQRHYCKWYSILYPTQTACRLQHIACILLLHSDWAEEEKKPCEWRENAWNDRKKERKKKIVFLLFFCAESISITLISVFIVSLISTFIFLSYNCDWARLPECWFWNHIPFSMLFSYCNMKIIFYALPFFPCEFFFL